MKVIFVSPYKKPVADIKWFIFMLMNWLVKIMMSQ